MRDKRGLCHAGDDAILDRPAHSWLDPGADRIGVGVSASRLDPSAVNGDRTRFAIYIANSRTPATGRRDVPSADGNVCLLYTSRCV